MTATAVGLDQLTDRPLPDWVPPEWHDEVGRKLGALGYAQAWAVAGAVALGWAVWAAIDDEALTVVSPDGQHKLHFAPGRKMQIKRAQRTIMRYADPEKMVRFAELEGDVGALFDALPDAPVSITLLRPEPPAPEPSRRPTLVLVSTAPMLAKSSKNKGYESKIAIERTWSDGSVDYKCVLCPYVNENRLGIRGHWQGHTRRGEAEVVGGPKPGERFDAQVPNAAHYAPRYYRVQALAELLGKMLEGGDFDIEELAKAALTWVHEQSNSGGQLSGEAEDLTDAQILQRIRTLVDHGVTDRLAAENEQLKAENMELRQQVVDASGQAESLVDTLDRELTDVRNRLSGLEAELEVAIAERDRFRERAARAQGDLQTLAELVRDIKIDVDEEGGA